MSDNNATTPQAKNTASHVFKTFLKLGLTSFGGPIAHIGYFHKEIVERQRWLNESQFSQLLAICQFLPGPASSQLGFALGLLRAGWIGALAAFVAFTLPSAILLIIFASLLPSLSGQLADAAIHGLKLVAVAVVADAVLGMSKKLCSDTTRKTMAILATSALLLGSGIVSPLWVVLAGAIAGIVLFRQSAEQDNQRIEVHYGNKLGISLFSIFFVLLIALSFSQEQASLTAVANVFYQAGAMVFGGGHVVLPLLDESVVQSGWVTDQAFIAGYGAAQAIPGPMFAVSSYLGALIPTQHSPILMALIALLFMFLPGFLLVSAVLPLWQSISKSQIALNAITGVNVAVVGLLAAALYDPIFTSAITSTSDLAISLIAFGLLAVWRLSPLYAVVWCVAASSLLVSVS